VVKRMLNKFVCRQKPVLQPTVYYMKLCVDRDLNCGQECYMKLFVDRDLKCG